MKLKPLHDRVLVRREEQETTTAAGIVLTGAAAEKPNRGKILAVGHGAILQDGQVRPMSLSVGDTVVFGQYSGSSVKIDGEDLLMMREEDVLAVVEEGEA